MSESKKNIEFNNGWILCPSKSFPGKFYYFNVLNGEAAWSLNQSDNKGFIKERSFHKIADKSHGYPEPTTLPHNIFATNKKPDFLQNIPSNYQLPKFGQATFPKYVTNTQPIIPNIVSPSVPFLMFCPEAEKPMFDQKLSKFENLTISQSTKQTTIPLCKRFKNYQKPHFSLERSNKLVKPFAKFKTSTPKNLFLECVSESQNFFSKTLIKEPTLKLEPKSTPKLPDVVKSNEKPIISFSGKVESTESSTEVPNIVKNENILLDSSDLRFLLLAKRRSTDPADTAVERKKPKATELKPLTLKKKVTFNLKAESDDDSANRETQEDYIPLTPNLTRTIMEAPKSPVLLKDKTPPSFTKESPKMPPPNEQLPTLQPTANYQRPTFNNTTWYIVVDTDVLLLDYELIDKVVLSDPKCRLIIPHAVAADIEALCLGDCHGQQRVINARQLTRKLATPPPHYIVEPRTSESGNIVVTTDSILNCCMKIVNKNYYVVLITNDPHLQIRATFLNIKSYKLNEIKFGVEIKPNITTPEKKNIKIIIPNNDVRDTKNQFNQSLFSNLGIKPEITSEEKNIKISSRNYIDVKNQYKNLNLISNKSPIKKQLFSSTDSDTDSSLDCDKLINITQQKEKKNIENINKSDIDGLSDISSEVSSLNLNDKIVFKPQNAGRNPFHTENVKENGFVNFEKRILNPNTVFNTDSFRKTISIEKPVSKTNHKTDDFQKDILEYNFENIENPFRSTPITNIKFFESKSKLGNSAKPVTPSTCLSLRQEPFGVTRENKLLNPSQTRIQKIIRTINNDSTTKKQLENQTPKTKDSTGLFKIPQLLPIKNATRYTSVHVENSTVNDQIGTRTNIDSIDENLKRFRIKSRNMRNKIKTRIDEWICSYMQIMEDALMHILQKNCVCMENTVAPLTLKDTLNCIKMLFGNHTKIRDFTNKLSELLDRCMQGKLKMYLIPEDFMKLFGYGVLLVESLKNVHPHNEELKETVLRLNNLQTNLESTKIEFDPELVKTPSLSKSEADMGLEEIRPQPQYFKKKSYVIDYLKKHFKEWEAYKEDLDEQNQIEDHTDFKVVRTIGKNLNLLKINNKKMMTLEGDLHNRNKDGPKIIRLLENNQISKPDNIENVEINTKNETKIMGPSYIEKNQNDFNSFSNENEVTAEKDVPLKKVIKNIENNESKVSEEFNYTTHENTFLENTDKSGPTIIRNIKLIDEFEKKVNNREPLDLDFSDIYEPSVDRNHIDFDIISEKNNNAEDMNKYNHFEDINYGLDNTMCTLEDFFITPSISPDSKHNNHTCDTEHSSNRIKQTVNSENITSRHFNSVSENNDKNEENNCEVESETYTENQESQNGSIIGNDNSEIRIDNSGTHLDNSEICNDNFRKTALMVRDDSTNDSGFENDRTYAHSLVKIFLNELSTTFKVIHTFVTKFIEEIRETKLSIKRKDALHNQASKALEDMVAIIQQLNSIIKRESAENTVLKMLLRNAGVEATTDKRMTRYRQIVIKCLGQAQILESALKVIVSTTMGDFEALSTNAETLNSSIRYFNIFE